MRRSHAPAAPAGCTLAMVLCGCQGRVPELRRALHVESAERELLLGCREIVMHRGQYRADPNVSGGDQQERRIDYPDAQDPRMPAVTRKWEVMRVMLGPDSGLLMLGRTQSYVSVEVLCTREGLPDEAEEARNWGFTEQLIPGLWYRERSD